MARPPSKRPAGLEARDRLDENSGAYTIEIAAVGHESKTVEAELTESVYFGEIRL